MVAKFIYESLAYSEGEWLVPTLANVKVSRIHMLYQKIISISYNMVEGNVLLHLLK